MKKSTTNKLKILNDPIYGFIRIPNSLIFDIIEDPYFQRLRRITQMGLSNLVYPGANHTRFHHAIGCLELMQKTVRVLRFKGVELSEEEENGVYIAILLHDIGHGPFSHALEHSIVEGITHEELSLAYMNALNKKFDGQLSLAISIFKGTYKRRFLHQLISSQLDIDRLDYLKRDSFYTGVTEGNIGSDRLIAMMSVVNDELVIEKKGIYSVEKFLIARRLMYWQVYLHKTGLVAEIMLVNILKRAKELARQQVDLVLPESLNFFMNETITANTFTQEVLDKFALLDDYDIISALKSWTHHTDYVLSTLSKMILNRSLLKIEIQNNPFEWSYVNSLQDRLQATTALTAHELSYFIFQDKISNQAYNPKQPILIVTKKGSLKDIAQASDQLNLQALSSPVTKHFICYPKKLTID